MRADRTPRAVVIAGPNGAGKTLSAPDLLQEAVGIDAFVNADVIAQGLAAFSPESAAFMAGRIMLRRIEELARAREDFAFESTLAGRSAHRLLTGLVGVGYDVHIFYTLAAITRHGGGQGAPARGGGRSRRARAGHPADVRSSRTERGRASRWC
jgi:predicted ABC-type ATPase